MTVLNHIRERSFDDSLHTAWVDEDEGVAVFPLWNLSGRMVGYQQYRPSANKKKCNDPKMSRYFTYRKGRVVGVWGLESWNLSNTLFVTEGVFDATRITSLGYSAIATLSNDIDDSTKNWFKCIKTNRFVVAVCDNDSSGLRLAKCGHESHVVEIGDLGSVPEEYVVNLLKGYG